MLIFLGVVFSCSTYDKTTIPNSGWKDLSDLTGEWTELERDKEGYFLYKPCDGDTPKILVTKDSIKLIPQVETPINLKISNYSITADSIVVNIASGNLNAEFIFKTVEPNAEYILYKWYFPEYENRGKRIITRSALAQKFRTVSNPCDNVKIPDQEFLPVEYD